MFTCPCPDAREQCLIAFCGHMRFALSTNNRSPQARRVRKNNQNEKDIGIVRACARARLGCGCGNGSPRWVRAYAIGVNERAPKR